MHRAKFAAGALLVASIAGCATTDAPNTRVDYDRKADFSVYRTFGFPKAVSYTHLTLPTNREV